MLEELLVAQITLTEGFEFHLAAESTPEAALCGATVQATQIPPYFWAVESAIEGRWCAHCERLSRKRAERASIEKEPGYAPCV